MYTSVFLAIILSLIESILGSHVENNQVIIGSSVGGVLGLVSRSRENKMKYSLNAILDYFNIGSDSDI